MSSKQGPPARKPKQGPPAPTSEQYYIGIWWICDPQRTWEAHTTIICKSELNAWKCMAKELLEILGTDGDFSLSEKLRSNSFEHWENMIDSYNVPYDVRDFCDEYCRYDDNVKYEVRSLTMEN